MLAILQLLFSLDTLAQTARDEKTLWQPYYISPRTASESAELHINLSGEWQLGWRDTANSGVDELASQSKWIRARVPATVQMALHYAGELAASVLQPQFRSGKIKSEFGISTA